MNYMMFSCTSAHRSGYAGRTFSWDFHKCVMLRLLHVWLGFSHISYHASLAAGSLALSTCISCNVKKRVGFRGTVSVHTSGRDNWWKLTKDAVPNEMATTKGSMKAKENVSLHSILSTAMGATKGFAHLHGQVHQATVLIDGTSKEKKTNRSWEMLYMEKLNPHFRKPLL